MKNTLRTPVVCFNPAEARALKARVYDLSELAVKQALYGIIQILSVRANLPRPIFEEIIDDATKYSNIKERG
jgi:hypothetical protein